MHLHTFSIVAYAPKEDAWGVAVASKFLAAGALVSWARAGAGAVATQALAKVGFGPDGLAMLGAGKSAGETLAALLADDPQRERRQVGIVDAQGGAAAHTGSECHDWAGHKVGEGFTCQGNILVGAETLEAMAAAFTQTSGELADRLVAALLAGDSAGGDKRGKQAAGVLVVRAGGGYGGDTDHYLDLRVDDDADPIRKLAQLVKTHHLFFGKPRPQDQIPITDDIASELQTMMLEQGYLVGQSDGVWDEASQQAFWALVGNENLEERWNLEQSPDKIDKVALEYLRKRFAE
ncbi:MAG: DUF1028 domain-containing protein [Anaerolineaceae bacterium]|nr:DUF1028 domain-containing protein [Anaerolineaceae bacterium]